MRIIYKVTNKINGKIYIGQTHLSLAKRKWLHNKSASDNINTVFYKALRKYGIDNFRWEILCYCKEDKDLNKKEILNIQTLKTLIPNGYNMTEGGENRSGKNNPMYNRRQSQKCKDINRKMRLGKNLSIVIRNKISEGLRGKRCSEYSKKVNAERLKGDNNIAIKYLWYVLTPDNITEKVKCFKEWCQKNNLNYDSMRNNLPRYGHSNGYKLIKKEKINYVEKF